MPDRSDPEEDLESDGDIMAGDRRIARTDTALPDWYVSDAAYRPLPIVWFGGALILQVIIQPGVFWLFALIMEASPIITAAVALLASGIIWHLAMRRGMSRAFFAWRFATGAMLAFFFSLTALTALA